MTLDWCALGGVAMLQYTDDDIRNMKKYLAKWLSPYFLFNGDRV